MIAAPAAEPAAAPVPPAGSRRPRRAVAVLPWVAVLSAGVGLGAAGARRFDPPAEAEKSAAGPKSAESPDVITFPADKQAAAGVEVVPVAAEPLVCRVWRSGRVTLDEDHVAHVCPPGDGVVRDVPVRLGQTVAAGEVLAVLDSREFGQAKLDALKAKLALASEKEVADRTRTTTANADELLKLLAADTPLSEVETRMADKPIGDWRQQLLTAYTRRNQLRARVAAQKSAGGGAVSESMLRQTEADAEAAGAAYTALVEDLRFQVQNLVRQADLKLRDAATAFDVAKAKLLLFGVPAADVEKLDPLAEGAKMSLLPVRAPFAGTVVEKHAVASERVGPATQMFTVADLSAVWVRADVFEADLPLLKGLAGGSIVFRSAVGGVAERPATVVYAGDIIDPNSRVLTLTAAAANPDRALKPGMFVEVGFETGDRSPVIHLPAAAVLRHENKPFVFVRTAADTFRRADVTLGRTAGDRVEITAGLKPADEVVVRGGFVLKSEMLKDQMVGE